MARRASTAVLEPVSSAPAEETKAPEIRTEPSTWRYRVLKPVELARGVPGEVGQNLQGQTIMVKGRIDFEQKYYPAEMMVEGRSIKTTLAMIPGCINGMVASGSHGRMIKVDISGEIRLTEDEVRSLRVGQVEPIDVDAPAVPSGLIDIMVQDRLVMDRMNLEGKSPEETIHDLSGRLSELERHNQALRQDGVHF
jgi:hypothetical protein